MWLLLSLCAIYAIALIVARIWFNGPALAGQLESWMNKKFRGRTEIRSVTWPTSSAHRWIVGGWVPVEMEGVKVWDGEMLVFETERITGEVDAHALAFGGDLVFQNVKVPDGGFLLIRRIENSRWVKDNKYDKLEYSIISAFHGKRSADKISSGIKAGDGGVFDIRDYAFNDLDIQIDIRTNEIEYPVVQLSLDDVSGKGFLYADASDPLDFKMYYSLRPDAESGELRLNIPGVRPRPIALTSFNTVHLAQLPLNWPTNSQSDLHFEFESETAQGATIKIGGALLDHQNQFFGGRYVGDLKIDSAGKQIAELTNYYAYGDNVEMNLHFGGPSILPNISIELRELESTLPGFLECKKFTARLPQLLVHADFATNEGLLEEAVVETAKGRLRLSSRFSMEGPKFHDIQISARQNEGLELARCVSPKVAAITGGTRLWGRANLRGTISTLALHNLDLHVGDLDISGSIGRQNDYGVGIKYLKLALGENEMLTEGSIDLQSMSAELDIKKIDMPRFDKILRRADLPAVARTMVGTGTIRGPFSLLRMKTNSTFGGVPIVDDVDVDAKILGTKISFDRIASESPRGSLSGSGALDLATASIDGISLEAKNLQLSRLHPALGGRGSANLEISGVSQRYNGFISFDTDGFSVLGDPFEKLSAEASLDRGAYRLTGIFARKRGGDGRLGVDVSRAGQLTGKLSLANLVLESFFSPEFPSSSDIGGIAFANLAISGSTAKPMLEGSVSVLRNWLRDGFLGDASFRLLPEGNDKIKILGEHSQGRLQYEALVTAQPPYETVVTLRFKDFEVDQIDRTIYDRYGVRGRVSGMVVLKKRLLSDDPPSMHLELDSFAATYQATSAELPGSVRALGPVIVDYKGGQFVLANTARFATSGGEVSISGSAGVERADLAVKGNIDVGLLSQLVALEAGDLSGRVSADVKIAGKWAQPRLAGEIGLDGLQLTQRGTGTTLTFGDAEIKLSGGSLTVEGLTIRTKDEFAKSEEEVNVFVQAQFDGFALSNWFVDITGTLSGQLLKVAVPSWVAEGSGGAGIDLRIQQDQGPLELIGDISFNNAKKNGDLTMLLRGIRRELRFANGRFDFSGENICFDNVLVRVDEEGAVRVGATGCENASASVIDLDGVVPTGVEATIQAENIPLRIPNTLDVRLSSDRLRVRGSDQLEVSGRIKVVEAIYTKNLEIDEIFKPSRTTVRSEPFFDSIPFIADAELGCDPSRDAECREDDELVLNLPEINIDNNVGQASLTGQNLRITGTPRDPRIQGTIRVASSQFRLPATRPTFTRTTGPIEFYKNRPIGVNNPEFDITSTADYRDQTGVDHLITLRVTGAYPNVTPRLFTDTGLDMSQTTSLIALGRTIDQVRQDLGDPALGGDLLTARDRDQDTSTLDRLGSDVFGYYFGGQVSNILQDVTDVDLIKLNISVSSFDLQAEERLLSNLKASLQLQQGAAVFRWSVSGELILSQDFSLETKYRVRSFTDNAQEDIRDWRLRVLRRITWR